jgi:hypothetical protein
MLHRTPVVTAAILIGLTAACRTPVSPEDWPVRDDPLFRSTVWIRAPDSIGSGVIVHSSGRGTYVLTAAHMTADEDALLIPESAVGVGVFSISHAPPIREPYRIYTADVVATNAPAASAEDDSVAGSLAGLRWLAGNDIAVLRLRTDRRFLAAPLYTGPPDAVGGTAAVVVPVAPELYPHRKPATCDAKSVTCMGLVAGNSGAPAFVDGRVVGIVTHLAWGPGPKKLQKFIREHEEIRFLLEEPTASAGVAETPDSGSQPAR